MLTVGRGCVLPALVNCVILLPFWQEGTFVVKGLSPLLVCCLINLFPGVRPTGICGTVRRIIAKPVFITKGDLQIAAGSRQLCAGQTAGIEPATHSIRSLLSRDESDIALLIDASNASTSIYIALRNTQLFYAHH